jgi:GNAT superfamily N-acetyltransferase
MQDSELQCAIERASLHSWPAITSERQGSWILRLGDGYSKRANSATYAGPEPRNPGAQIADCERRFRDAGLPPVFRLPSITQPQEVDRVLDSRGYRVIDRTTVMTKGVVVGGDPPVAGSDVVRVDPETWLRHFGLFSGISTERQEKHAALIGRIPVEPIHAAIRDPEGIAGVALAVVVDGLAGIFDVVTNPARRKTGFGTRLMQGVHRLCAQHGARLLYLQVLEGNAPALRLYGSLGFEAEYGYWYRA